jgi:hypothetical protein
MPVVLCPNTAEEINMILILKVQLGNGAMEKIMRASCQKDPSTSIPSKRIV